MLHIWSQVDEILLSLGKHQLSNSDYLAAASKALNRMMDMQKSSTLQFIQSQLQMLLTTKKNLRYSKHVIIIAAELLCTSPAAYGMLRRSRIINLPREQLIRDLTSCSFQDVNMPVIFSDLKPQQRILNIIFDEVK